MNATTSETATRPRLPALAAPGEARREALEVLRRFHLGAPDASAGEVPSGAVPAAFAAAQAAAPASATVLQLLQSAVTEARVAARNAFARQARELVARAEALLETERLKGPTARDPERLGGALGAAGGVLLDPTALSGMLGKPRLAGALGETRARRLEAAAEVLRQGASEVGTARPVLVHNGTLPWSVAEVEELGWTALESSDPCTVAADLFDQEARRTGRVLLAARRVRLEAAGEYDPARHDLLLEGDLDWQAFTRDELSLVPPVVVLESAHELAAHAVAGLSKLLLSGRPVQVLVIDDPTAAPGAGSGEARLAGFRFQPGYLGLAAREAFVQQGSISRPEALAAAFRRAAGLARAALHVVAAPASAVPAEAAVAGRAHPLFVYDPEAGTSWADRMDFSGNPAPAEDWPVREIEVEEDGGAAARLVTAFTFADACLFAPDLAGEFLPVPTGVPAEALATVSEWLALEPAAALERVPYVLAAIPDPRAGGALVRLAVSRPLALACRDRLGYWRTLQELAGARSEYVRRAEERAREQADARVAAERERLEARHATELERVHRRAVEEVVNRLTAAVLGVDPAAFESPLAALAGGELDDLSAQLLGMVAGIDPELEADLPANEAVDRVMSELTGLLGPLDPASESGVNAP